ncbi:putative acyltransferase [Smittium mucronatum]|uniref:Putative acyltransferase n=1 Tax=Smittium mucronatum TaxID=133383 RepID=A0A1R0H821_9FUNG|nr:putative acyltransferase [Smittium mucronatum]
MMSNHQAYIDWILLWSLLRLQNLEGSIKIVLKDSLKNIPIIGWGMQYFDFIFLKRNWNKDKETLESHMAKINKSKYPTTLLLFPEGTTFTQNTLTKSLAYAAKTLPELHHPIHVILPRATGIRCCLQSLSSQKTKYLYDVTVAYSGVSSDEFAEDIYTMKNVFYNEGYPRKVHINIRRFLISEIPLEDESVFSTWLIDRFMEKDSMLDYYYKNGNFHAQDKIPYLTDPLTKVQAILGMRSLFLAFVSICFFIKLLY